MGVPSFEWTHFSTRISRLINMLKSDGQQVMYREQARATEAQGPPGEGVGSELPGVREETHWEAGQSLSWIRAVV